MKKFARIETDKGTIRLELYEEQVPETVKNFIKLANGNFYNGLKFHRVIPNFMIQGGCPNGDGRGGPGYTFGDEFHRELRHDRAGRLSMANSGPHSNGSQFFITHLPTPWLDDVHTIFGQVVEGQDVVKAIKQGDIMHSITIESEG